MKLRIMSNEYGISIDRMSENKDKPGVLETIHISPELFRTLAALQTNPKHQVLFEQDIRGPERNSYGSGGSYWFKHNLVSVEQDA